MEFEFPKQNFKGECKSVCSTCKLRYVFFVSTNCCTLKALVDIKQIIGEQK